MTEQAEPEGALVQWVQKHDGVAVVPDEAAARRLNETIRKRVKHGGKVACYEYVDPVHLTLRERAQGRSYEVGDEVWESRGLYLPVGDMTATVIDGDVLTLSARDHQLRLDLSQPPPNLVGPAPALPRGSAR